MENETASTLPTPGAAAPAPLPSQPGQGESRPAEPQDLSAGQRRAMIFVILGVIVFVGLIIASLVLLMRAPLGEVARIRDIFIIFMAFQSLLTGLALIVLIVQLARLTNLLQNEVRPILDSTNETVSNLRGTTAFLSDNLVEPVIKLNEYLAGLSQLFAVLGLVKKTTDKKNPPRGV